MAAETPPELFRVVAIRRDGGRVVLASRLRIDRAEAIVSALCDVSAFKELLVEPESDDGGST